MKGKLKGIKENYTLSALLCVIFGIVLLIWPDNTTRIFCMSIGGILLAIGVIKILVFAFTHDGTLYSKGNLLLAIILCVIGAWIMIRPEGVIRLIPIMMGIIIVLHGVGDLRRVMQLMKGGYEKWWIALILALVTLGLGAVLILRPFQSVDFVVRILGAILILDGASDVWILHKVSVISRGVTTVDVEVTDEEIVVDEEDNREE
ncbi:MAG: DUF308 domain-containing protein [Lachnospiraceae bacterium]|nr:DUF308 domain-containing protein [Lachnospiraceae bacterium]